LVGTTADFPPPGPQHPLAFNDLAGENRETAGRIGEPRLALSVLVGFIVQGNFSNLTSAVLAVAAPRYRGATIGLYSCIGFGAGFLGTLLFGVTLDQFGGTSQLAAWTLSFGTCGLACLAGAAATMLLSRDLWRR
jgi:MFS family permease